MGLGGEPSGWAQLREEAKPLFKYLVIYKAELQKVNGVEQSMSGWRFFGEDENLTHDREKRNDPYGQWQEKQAQRKRMRRANRRKASKNT